MVHYLTTDQEVLNEVLVLCPLELEMCFYFIIKYSSSSCGFDQN